jgi:hypothetical protein
MAHSYEELRLAVYDVLSGRIHVGINVNIPVQDFNSLKIGVGKSLESKGLQDPRPPYGYVADNALDPSDAAVVRQLFWELFRQGILTPGKDGLNDNFPYFEITDFGRRAVTGEESYFVHDVSGYEARMKKEVPSVDSVTLLYLKESLQAFRSDCVLASTVMLGVAAEHTFNLLLETVEKNPKFNSVYAAALKERTTLRRVETFRKLVEPRVGEMDSTLKEGLATNFLGILEIIRGFRNDSGHPSGKIVSAEQAHALLLLFPMYCRKMYSMMEYFRAPHQQK